MFMLASKNTVALPLSRSLLTFGRISLEEIERHFTDGNVFLALKKKLKESERTADVERTKGSHGLWEPDWRSFWWHTDKI